MRTSRYVMGITALVLLLLVAAGGAAAADVEITLLNAFAETGPRRPVTFLAEVENNSSRELYLLPSLSLPDGWREVVPAQSVRLAMGETKKVLSTAQALNSDIFGFGWMLYRKEYKHWQGMEADWDEIFPQITLKMDVRADIRRSGLVAKVGTKQ
ncbi:MAG: Ger(x)C family spore germination C-terminal domain-containing protein [Limnochordia bacterium]|jgi:hypothetical protein